MTALCKTIASGELSQVFTLGRNAGDVSVHLLYEILQLYNSS